jgi:predicted amidohydrolase YtcJ
MKLTRKIALTFSLLVVALGLALGTAVAKKIVADTIYFNGTVLTVDQSNTVANAIAIQDDKILAVGSVGKCMRFYKSSTKLVNLYGKTIIPGFYDAHSHFQYAGEGYLTKVQLQSPPIGTIKNMDELLAALSARADTTEPGGWVQGTGYDDIELAEKRHPTVEDLDTVSTTLPIIITHFSGHNVVVNSVALAMAGITKDTPDPAGGQIGRFPDGTPNGQLWETAMGLVKGVPAITYQQRLEALALASDIYASKGVTTANNGYGSSFAIFEEAADDGYLKIRVALWFDVSMGKSVHDALGTDRSIPKYTGRNDLVVSGGIKFIEDGSPQLRTAFLTDPYFTTGSYPAGWVAYPWYSREKLMAMVVEAHVAGFDNIFIHGNGDGAIDYILDAYAEVRKPEYRQSDKLRHVVIHSQFSREDQLDRMQELGVIPSFLILHTYYLGDRHWTIFFGPDRSARMSATQDAIDRNLPFTIHSDTPVFPMNPLLEMWAAVNRLSYTGREIFTTTYKDGDKYRSVDQRITPLEALRASTINGAYANGEDDLTGSLEAGKRADLVILSANPLRVDPLTIKDIKVLKTIVGGKTVYKAPSK